MLHSEKVCLNLPHGPAVVDVSVDENDIVHSLYITGADLPEDATAWGNLISNLLGTVLVVLPAVHFQAQYGVHKYRVSPTAVSLSFVPETGPASNLAAPSLGSLYITTDSEEHHTRMAVRRRDTWGIDSIVMADFDNFGGLLRLAVEE